MSDTTCTNPACKNPEAPLAARGLCWPCYQSQRRASMPKRRVPLCVDGHRYHSYDIKDKCKHCGAFRVFGV